nr:MAG TPA: SECRETED 45 KDA PROTEIN CYCLE, PEPTIDOGLYCAN, CHAP, CELL [Caudoviricetes sp.]
MGDLVLNIPKLLEGLPQSVSTLVIVLLVLIGVRWKEKKTNVEVRKVDDDIRGQQISGLMAQIKVLTDQIKTLTEDIAHYQVQIGELRSQLDDQYRQNIQLTTQLKEANKRISELEISLALYDNAKTNGVDVRLFQVE